jgi:hypothetical protein
MSTEPSGPDEIPDDEILPEYDLKNAVRGKYAKRYAEGVTIRVDGEPPASSSREPDTTEGTEEAE